jgi:hypothetical protein
MVAGRFVVVDGRVAGLDTRATLARARDVAAGLWSRMA